MRNLYHIELRTNSKSEYKFNSIQLYSLLQRKNKRFQTRTTQIVVQANSIMYLLFNSIPDLQNHIEFLKKNIFTFHVQLTSN